MTTKTPPAPDAGADPFARERGALDALDAFMGESADGPTPDGYARNAKGHLVPDRLVPESARLEDATVRTMVAYALDLHRQIQRFVGHCYDDMAAMDDLIAERYGLKRRGGAKGNRTYMSFNGCLRVVVQVQDRIAFGAELQVARDLVNACIADWAEGTRDEVQALIRHAFEPDKQGQVNREAVFRLRRLDIDDERWRQAQAAIADAIRVVGSASYVRFYVRPSPEARRWSAITIDMTGTPLPERLAS